MKWFNRLGLTMAMCGIWLLIVNYGYLHHPVAFIISGALVIFGCTLLLQEYD